MSGCSFGQVTAFSKVTARFLVALQGWTALHVCTCNTDHMDSFLSEFSEGMYYKICDMKERWDIPSYVDRVSSCWAMFCIGLQCMIA